MAKNLKVEIEKCDHEYNSFTQSYNTVFNSSELLSIINIEEYNRFNVMLKIFNVPKLSDVNEADYDKVKLQHKKNTSHEAYSNYGRRLY